MGKLNIATFAEKVKRHLRSLFGYTSFGIATGNTQVMKLRGRRLLQVVHYIVGGQKSNFYFYQICHTTTATLKVRSSI